MSHNNQVAEVNVVAEYEQALGRELTVTELISVKTGQLGSFLANSVTDGAKELSYMGSVCGEAYGFCNRRAKEETEANDIRRSANLALLKMVSR